MANDSQMPGGYWDPNRWGPSELVGQSWERFREDWPVLLGSLFVGWLILSAVTVPLVLFLARMGSHHRSATTGLLFSPGFLLLIAAAYVLGTAVQAGWIAVFTASARGEKPELGLLFTGMKGFGRLLGVVILQSLIITVGAALLIVPGILAAIGLFCAPYWAVDAGLGPIDALKASWENSKGHWWNIFLLFLLCLGVMIAGELACGVGVLIAVPLVFLSQAMLYLRLSQGAVGQARPPQSGSDGFPA